MIETPINWYTISREDLLDVLVGEDSEQLLNVFQFPAADLKFGKIALGYKEHPADTKYAPPSLVIIGDDGLAETMSWIRAYAGEAAPISQFARVALASDWTALGEARDVLFHDDYRPDRWACVAVGEALSQADGDPDLQNMPLSRVSSCLSIAAGRASLIYGQGKLTRICVDRLRVLATDRRINRRALQVEQLLPAWAIVGSHISGYVSPTEAAEMVMSAASEHFRAALPRSAWLTMDRLKDFSGLSSDSIEERVVAFNKVSQELLGAPGLSVEAGGPILAAAAFLVGRSTSHAFLLRRIGRMMPTAMAWFGVMAALAGPRAWDSSWLRAVKGAERLLRPEFSWVDAPSADIGWAEFAWLAGMFEDLGEQLAMLPKMLPRSISIEVVPGANLQVRLGQGSSESESRLTEEISVRDLALQDALTQLVSVAQRVRGLVERSNSSSAPQQPLDLEHEQPRSMKGARVKRQRREPDVG